MNFIPVFTILIVACFSKIVTKSWFSPGSFFSLMWFFFTLIPVVFAPGYEINNSGLWYIAIFTMACSSGSVVAVIIAPSYSISIAKHDNNQYSNLAYSLFFFNAISVFGLISLLFYLRSNYLSFESSISIFSLPNLVSVDRYSENLFYPAFIKYSLYFIYPSNIIAGILFINSKTKKSLINIFLPLLLSILLGVIEGSRTSILLGSILFISSLISTRILKNDGKLSLSPIKIFICILFSILIFIILFIFVQWLRQDLNPIIIDLILIRVKAYFFGYLSAFTLWFSDSGSLISITSYLSTFAGPMNLIGIIERDLGFYETISINNYTSTNIYTAFRGLITDFSIVGSFLFNFCIGIFFQLQFQKERKFLYDGVLPLSIFYSFTLYSPLISIFHYNSIFFSWIVVFIVKKINFR
tara:strand:- start:959 stop:2194 length:1236 start_codon:yes stop_codon:yes gene_type:complete